MLVIILQFLVNQFTFGHEDFLDLIEVFFSDIQILLDCFYGDFWDLKFRHVVYLFNRELERVGVVFF